MPQYSVPAPIVGGGLAALNETEKKGLEKISIHSATSVTDFIPRLYKQKNFENGERKIKSKVYAGLTQASLWDGESILSPEGMQFLYDVDVQTYWYGKSTEYTLDAKTFDKYNVFPKLSAELGKSVGEKRQRLAASLFNGGFTTAFADGVYFFSASHPFDTRLGGVQSNLVAGALSVSTLADAINLMLNTRDPLGRPMTLTPKYLYVYPTKVMFAKQVLNLGLGQEYGTANNNRNPFGDFSIQVVPYPWFSTSTMWMLQAAEYETYHSMSVGITSTMDKTDAHGTKHDVFFNEAFWAERWEGFVGSTGL